MEKPLSRAQKTTKQQYITMISFIKHHPEMINGKLTKKYTAKKREYLWGQLTDLLNANDMGPKKNQVKWRKTWADFKCDVKSKIFEINNRRKNSVNGIPNNEVVNPLYEMVAELIGQDIIEEQEDVKPLWKKQKRNALKLNEENNTSFALESGKSSPIQNIGQQIDQQINQEIDQQINLQLIEAKNKKATAIERLAEAYEKRNIIEKEKNEIFARIANNLEKLIEK